MLEVAVLLATVVTGPAGNAQKLDLTAELHSLIEVERAFAKAVGEKGIRDGFLAYLAEDGVLFRPGPVIGKQWMADRPASRAHLAWEPVFASVARSGDLGYTTGPWEMREQGPRSLPTRFGHYVTIWRRQPRGDWKAVLDAGTTGPKPAARARPYRPEASPGGPVVLRPAADPDSERVVVLQLDRDFSDLSVAKGTVVAYDAFAAPELRLLREQRAPLVGAAAARPHLLAQSGRLTCAPEHAEVSRASDLAFTYGAYRHAPGGAAAKAAAESGYYVHVWKRQASGAWRLALDLMSPAP